MSHLFSISIVDVLTMSSAHACPSRDSTVPFDLNLAGWRCHRET